MENWGKSFLVGPSQVFADPQTFNSLKWLSAVFSQSVNHWNSATLTHKWIFSLALQTIQLKFYLLCRLNKHVFWSPKIAILLIWLQLSSPMHNFLWFLLRDFLISVWVAKGSNFGNPIFFILYCIVLYRISLNFMTPHFWKVPSNCWIELCEKCNHVVWLFPPIFI